MSEPTLHFTACSAVEPHRMAYWRWGNPEAAHTVLCVHGLSRQGRDFDVLARALLDRSGQDLQIICPDIVGRGESDWLTHAEGYQLPTYAADVLGLIAALRPARLDWVGTSMGGLIGMAVANHAPSVGARVRRLVLNDVGPSIQWASLQRIGAYLGQSMHFGSVESAAAAMWSISQSFGPHTPEQWLELSRHMVKVEGDVVRLHYDPAIAVPFRAVTEASAQQGEALLWQLYDAIEAQTLLLRGAQSDLLSEETARAMTQRGPRAQLREFQGVGHAPTLIAPDQLQVLCDFVLGE